jgi:hypothetical protein
MASLIRVIGKILQVFAVSALVIGAFLLAYGGWIQWEVHKMKSFCSDAKPGTPVDHLQAIADSHGVQLHGTEGVYSESTKNWFLPVPVMPTFGDIACLIRHDKKTVQSATMDGL